MKHSSKYLGWSYLEEEDKTELGDVYTQREDSFKMPAYRMFHPEKEERRYTISHSQIGLRVGGEPYYIFYRKTKSDKPRRLPMNPYFSKPLPLP